MILDKIVTIKTNPSNYKHYIEKGYLIKICGEEIDINVLDLPTGSKVKLQCKCSNCETIKDVIYKNYRRQLSNHEFYVCSKCFYIKAKLTNYALYNTTSYTTTEEYKSRYRNTCIDRYGIDNASKSESVKLKTKQTCLNRYGVDNPSKSSTFKLKKSETCIEKHNVSHYSKTDEYKEKFKQTCLDIYGVDNPFKSEKIKKNISKKNVDSGRWYKYDKTTYVEYRRIIDRLTNNNKSQLYKEWDGYDYYDNEFILENFKLDFNHRYYPSIDHKISVMYGFIHNIEVEDLSNINNLCITKRYINSSKHSMTEFEFKNKINNGN